jgi:hypothetical protein
MNESIIFFPSRTLCKLQELVFMKETRTVGSASTSSNSKNKEVSAFKSEAEKLGRPKPKHPCSPGKHNALAFHPAWRCFKLLKEERDTLLPKEAETHLNSVDVEDNHDQPDDKEYIKVAVYLANEQILNLLS